MHKDIYYLLTEHDSISLLLRKFTFLFAWKLFENSCVLRARETTHFTIYQEPKHTAAKNFMRLRVFWCKIRCKTRGRMFFGLSDFFSDILTNELQVFQIYRGRWQSRLIPLKTDKKTKMSAIKHATVCFKHAVMSVSSGLLFFLQNLFVCSGTFPEIKNRGRLI